MILEIYIEKKIIQIMITYILIPSSKIFKNFFLFILFSSKIFYQ